MKYAVVEKIPHLADTGGEMREVLGVYTSAARALAWARRMGGAGWQHRYLVVNAVGVSYDLTKAKRIHKSAGLDEVNLREVSS